MQRPALLLQLLCNLCSLLQLHFTDPTSQSPWWKAVFHDVGSLSSPMQLMALLLCRCHCAAHNRVCCDQPATHSTIVIACSNIMVSSQLPFCNAWNHCNCLLQLAESYLAITLRLAVPMRLLLQLTESLQLLLKIAVPLQLLFLHCGIFWVADATCGIIASALATCRIIAIAFATLGILVIRFLCNCLHNWRDHHNCFCSLLNCHNNFWDLQDLCDHFCISREHSGCLRNSCNHSNCL